jgi:hypothetical protein
MIMEGTSREAAAAHLTSPTMEGTSRRQVVRVSSDSELISDGLFDLLHSPTRATLHGAGGTGEDSKSGVLASSSSTCMEPLCIRGHVDMSKTHTVERGYRAAITSAQHAKRSSNTDNVIRMRT